MYKRTVILAILLVMSIGTIEAEIINIPDDQETIQAGIDAAEDGGTVLVQLGAYFENIDFDGHNIVIGSLFLTTGNKEYIDETIIDGNRQGSVVTIIERVTSDAKLSGFTIQNGSGTSYFFGEYYGGGIFVIQSDIVIEHCIIRDNYVSDEFGRLSGGGIALIGWIDGTNPTIRDCEIYNNSSDGYGGGIAILSGCNPNFESVVITDNSAESGGGIIILGQCDVSMEYCVISRNTVEYVGGGIWIDHNSTLELKNVTIARNSTERFGGGIFADGSVDISALNTIFRNDDPQEIYFAEENEPSSISLEYCALEGGEEEIITNDNADVAWGEGNIEQNPLSADPEEGDYQLTADSPCIDASDPEADLDPDGTRADMGAYYFHQLDIDVSPIQIEFPAIEWGEWDSVQVNIINTGGTDLNITEILYPLHSAHMFLQYVNPDNLPILIEPADTLSLYAYNHPDWRVMSQS